MGYRCPECLREFGDNQGAFRAHALEAHRVDVRDRLEPLLWAERLSFRRREAAADSTFEDNRGAVRRPGEPHKLEQEGPTPSPATNSTRAGGHPGAGLDPRGPDHEPNAPGSGE